MNINLGALRKLYRSGEARPSDVVAQIYDAIPRESQPIWISLLPREVAMAKARALEKDALAPARPLYGVPFAIKDNIDLAGLATTAGCPAYSYMPAGSATVVQALLDAGAIPIGKTNLDQFATGLVGARSPHGGCSSAFDPRYISGGSSSGSAVAVAKGLASFSLGTDTAGSGRVPAAFNGLIGLKPTRGVLSTMGVVPACRTLDCVSILAQTCHDAHTVLQAARGFDPLDPYSRAPRPGQDAAPWLSATRPGTTAESAANGSRPDGAHGYGAPGKHAASSGGPTEQSTARGGPFRVGIPAAEQLEFFGDEEAAALYERAIETVEAIGGQRVEIDFSIFRAAADLLYSGPWVAERLAALLPFVESHAAEMNPVVREIISGARQYSAVQAFQAEYRLRELRRASEAEWDKMDVLLLPTTGTIYTHEAVAADPIRLNTNLGYYTNFANLLDLAVVAVPAGQRSMGLPFGVSFMGPSFSDEALLVVADRFHRSQGAVPGPPVELEAMPPGCVTVAVVGAHLSGQPLNWQLTERGARRIRSCRTAAGYRLYKLEGTVPSKPGLVRDPSFSGPGIEVEVWAIPEDRFGGFVANVPAPLGIGKATLEDGEVVSCFICEPFAVPGAAEITRFGGWRNYMMQPVSVR